MTVVDRLAGVREGLGRKAPVIAATTANITLSGLQVVDGIALSSGDRVLVKDQTTANQNGIYNASTGAWKRAADFNGPRDIVAGTSVLVGLGTANGGKEFYVANSGAIAIGTTELTFAITASSTQEVIPATVNWSQVVGEPSTFPSDWSIVANKPTTFTPAAHTHVAASITDLRADIFAALAEGTGVALTYNNGVTTISASGGGGGGGGVVDWTDITSKPATFPSDWATLSSKPTSFASDWSTLASKPATFPSDWSTLANKPTTFAPAAHTQAISTITGLQAALDNTAVSRYASRGALSAATVGGTINFIQVEGHTASGDGGHAIYTRSGTSLDLTKAWNLQSADGAYWKLIERVVNPRMLGATGGSDDSVPINSCLSYLASIGGGVLRIDETFYGQNLQVGTNTLVTGRGTVKRAPSEGAIFKLIGIHACIDGISLDGNNTGFTNGVIITGGACAVRNTIMTNFIAGTGIFIQDGGHGAIIENNIIFGLSDGIGIFALPSAAGRCDRGIIRGNVVYQIGQHGIFIANGPSWGFCDSWIITGNRVFDCGFTGLPTPGGGAIWANFRSTNVMVSDNHCYNCNGDLISTQGAQRMTVTGNICHDAKGPAGDDQNSGIVASDNGSALVTISGNVCFRNSACGIILNSQNGGNGDASMISITGNVVFNNSQVGAFGSWSGIQVFDSNTVTNVYTANIIGNVSDGGGRCQWGINALDLKSGIVSGNLCSNNIQAKQIAYPLNMGGLVKVIGNQGFHPGRLNDAPGIPHGGGIANPYPFPVDLYINTYNAPTITQVYLNGIALYDGVGISRFFFIAEPGDSIQVNYAGGVLTSNWIGRQ